MYYSRIYSRCNILDWLLEVYSCLSETVLHSAWEIVIYKYPCGKAVMGALFPLRYWNHALSCFHQNTPTIDMILTEIRVISTHFTHSAGLTRCRTQSSYRMLYRQAHLLGYVSLMGLGESMYGFCANNEPRLEKRENYAQSRSMDIPSYIVGIDRSWPCFCKLIHLVCLKRTVTSL